MCSSKPKSGGVPAQPGLVPILPAQILQLSEAARLQVAGKGTGLKELRIPTSAQVLNKKPNERLRINPS